MSSRLVALRITFVVGLNSGVKPSFPLQENPDGLEREPNGLGVRGHGAMAPLWRFDIFSGYQDRLGTPTAF